jgi:RHS repeat-associated protein
MTVRYTVIDGEIISENRGGTERDYVPDPLGSTVALLDSNQAQTDAFQYWPYGEQRSRTGTSAVQLRFGGAQGYYRDSGRLTYVRTRHYVPDLGRWLTADPSTMGDGMPSHQYCADSPVSVSDRSGLGCEPVVYNCSRPLIGSPEFLRHTFLWIHYPCSKDKDTTIGYGPPDNYPGNSWPVIPSDMRAIKTGRAFCARTNCAVGCATRQGQRIRPGDSRWDPGFFFGHPGTRDYICWDFTDFALNECQCSENGPPFFPNEPPPRPRPYPLGYPRPLW